MDYVSVMKPRLVGLFLFTVVAAMLLAKACKTPAMPIVSMARATIVSNSVRPLLSAKTDFRLPAGLLVEDLHHIR